MKHDVIVAGLGAHGSSAAYHLSCRGHNVLGIEAFQRGHTLGSSGGKTRIIRVSYYEHPDYVPLVQRAWELWRELERESGATLLTQTGGLYLGEPDGALVAGSLRSVRQYGLEHELLSAAAVRSRYPMFEIKDSWQGVHDIQAGYLVPELCIETNLRLAEKHGAQLQFGQRISGWEQTANGVSVTADGVLHEAERLVIAAGAWIGQLLPELAPMLMPERNPLFWFEPKGELAELAKLPVYLVEGGTYGFPYLDGQGLKAGVGHTGERCDPNTLDREIRGSDEAAIRDRLQGFLAVANGKLLDAKVCMYTNSTDGNFIIDRRDRVTFASACSGHGFKFSSVMGEVLADLATSGRTALPIDFLSTARPALHGAVAASAHLR